jgi:hypothetical protein
LADLGRRWSKYMYKNTYNALRLCKLDAVIGQGKMVLVREKSWKSQGILISLLCGNPDRLILKNIIIQIFLAETP